MSRSLRHKDYLRLVKDRSPNVRADTAQRIANDFDVGVLSESERRQAVEIFRLMLRDAEVRVRVALSEALKECREVPHDIAITLARDVETVALPMLRYSEVLTDDDLIAIVSSQDVVKQGAIAQRAEISALVAEALVDGGTEEVVAKLMGNDGADLSDSTLNRVLDEFADSDAVKDPMAYRRQLPVSVAERLVTMVSEQLRDHLRAHRELQPWITSDLVLQSWERATMSLSKEETAPELVETLASNGRLTPSIIIHALSTCDMPFFESAMATLARLPIATARTLIHDGGPLGLKALFDRTRLPSVMFPIIIIAIEVAHSTDHDDSEDGRKRFAQLMIERVMAHFKDPAEEMDMRSVEYLLGSFTQLADDGDGVAFKATSGD